jgi:hypothetical protein
MVPRSSRAKRSGSSRAASRTIVSRDVLEQSEQPLLEFVAAGELRRAIDRPEPRAVEWFQQVVDCVCIEGAHRVRIVGRHENDSRHFGRPMASSTPKPSSPGILDVQPTYP